MNRKNLVKSRKMSEISTSKNGMKNEYISNKRIHYCIDVRNSLLIDCFEKRGWNELPKWDIFWTNSLNLKLSNSYNHIGYHRLQRHQKVNHFPNSDELCRKDLLVKNLQRYIIDNQVVDQNTNEFDILPTTFHLPIEYDQFLVEFRKYQKSLWIMKPFDGCQGDGIYLVNRLLEVKRRLYNNNVLNSQYLISRYIDNPLLIGGRKFDIRLFVLVTSFRPLRAYLYNEGFCRMCCERYTNNIDGIENKYIHLTNVSVQKKCPKYNHIHGGKWSLRSFKLYMKGMYGDDVTKNLFRNISSVIKHSLKAVQPVIYNGSNFFECYGYDILIDRELKPWLVEVNSKPSLNGTTENDCNLKERLIDGILNIVCSQQKPEKNNFQVLFFELKKKK